MATQHYRKTGTDEVIPVDGDKVADFEAEDTKGEWEGISPGLYRTLSAKKDNIQKVQVKGEHGTNIDV